jgi:hypothetical protein
LTLFEFPGKSLAKPSWNPCKTREKGSPAQTEATLTPQKPAAAKSGKSAKRAENPQIVRKFGPKRGEP